MRKMSGKLRERFRASSDTVNKLLLLNLSLQLFDGVATYQGIALGWKEGNPLLRLMMAHWGAGWALIVFKGWACVMLHLLSRMRNLFVVLTAFWVAALCYLALSFIPWFTRFVLLLLAWL